MPKWRCVLLIKGLELNMQVVSEWKSKLGGQGHPANESMYIQSPIGSNRLT